MERITKFLDLVALVVKAQSDDLKDQIKEFPDVELLVQYVEDFETEVYGLLKDQQKHYIDGIQSMVSKADDQVALSVFINFYMQDILASDTFSENMSDSAKAFLDMSIPVLTSNIMELIDKDVPFNVMSGRTVKWVEDWSPELGRLMNLRSHEAVQDVLTRTLSEGKGIADAIRELQDLPEFNRKRARATAVTEVLTASSVAANEAYDQSPAVTGKTWKHSGAKKNNPRPAHVALSGTTVATDSTFNVNGYTAKFPRDTTLPAKERVHCHCVLSPSVDEKILGLSVADKEAIRQQALSSLK